MRYLPELIIIIIINLILIISNNNNLTTNSKILANHINEFSITDNTIQFYSYSFIILIYILLKLYNFNKQRLDDGNCKFFFLSILILIIFQINAFLCLYSLIIVFIFINIYPRFRILSHIILIIVTITYFIFLIFKPFGTPLSIGTISAWQNVESHYVMTVYPGYEIYSNFSFNNKIPFNYGILVTFFSYLGSKVHGLLFIEFHQLIFTVYFYQVACFISLIYLTLVIARRYLIISVSLILIASINLTSISSAIYLPNQSGIRYFGLFISLIIIFHITNMKNYVYYLSIITINCHYYYCYIPVYYYLGYYLIWFVVYY
jgi:hypothetical protein